MWKSQIKKDSKVLQELKGLSGARLAVSMVLEVLDFITPLLQQALQRMGNFISWLLVTLIGKLCSSLV